MTEFENLSIIATNDGFKVERVISGELSIDKLSEILEQIDGAIEASKKNLADIPVQVAQRTAMLEKEISVLEQRRKGFDTVMQQVLTYREEQAKSKATAPTEQSTAQETKPEQPAAPAQ